MEIRRSELFAHASGHFLCAIITPENVVDWDDEEMEEFIGLNQWEPFEYYSGKDLLEIISTTALADEQFLESKGIEIIEDI